MVPSRVAGGITQSSSSSGIFFQGDRQSQLEGNSQLNSNFGNSSNLCGGRANIAPLSGDVSNTVLNSVPSSGPSIGASSLVTDANSGLPVGPHLQRSASINNESYMRLPASPMSFSSNISGSCVIDGSSNMQPTNHDQGPLPGPLPGQQQGSSCVTSLPNSRMGQVQLPVSHLQKRPRLDIKQEGMLHQQVVHQLLQRQDSMHLQNSNPQLQALIQQQRIRQQQQQHQQQQLLQSMNPMQRAQLLQQQQLRQQLLQQQGQQQPASGMKRPYDGGVCSRRLMQYLYHQRQRPAENTIAYWRKFVAEYYSPRAKKRWCLSLYDNVGHHSLGVFPQASMDAWQCDICGSKSGRGFEATFEVLPRLNEIKFGSGVIDELLFLDLPREYRYPSGMMTLEYGKAVQETIYEQLRVVREGQLRIVFTTELKILSWEFCARRHEELLPRRLVAPQVNQLLQVAQKCQSTISESGSDGISQPDIQANSVMVVTAGRQLARSLELQSLNDLGFSKRYVRCLQIAEVVNSMKDLMDFSRDQKIGPIEGLKNFPRAGPKVHKMQEMEMGGIHGLPTDRNSMNKLMGLHPGPSSPMNNQHMVGGGGPLSGSAQSAHALNNYQNLMTRQNSMNSTHSLQHEPSSPLSTTTSNQPPTPRSSSVLPGTVQNSPQLQNPQSGNVFVPQNQSQSSNEALQQHMIQHLLHGMNNKKNAASASQISQNPVGNLSGERQGFRSSTSNVSVNVGNPPNGSSNFKATSNSEPPAGNFVFGQKSSDMTQNLNISDEMVQDIVHEFRENGFFSNDLDENFSWKD